MDPHIELLSRLAEPAESRIVLLVLDGLGDVRTAAQPRTALERARRPHLDELAARSALGRLVPVASGVTPGSGPGHLALFGYDPTRPEADIGRGVLEALGAGLPVARGDVAARGNFATADAGGELTDRRAGRISTAECERLCARLRQALDASPVAGLSAVVQAGEGHRFILLLRGEGLSAAIVDTDPQQLGVPPLEVRATAPEGEGTAERLRRVVALFEAAIADEPKANRVLLRGFSRLPHLPPLAELYRLSAAACAGYPLYRGAAAACGMEILSHDKKLADNLAAVRRRWDDFDLFFVHVKGTDQAGEDGDLEGKVRVIEEVDALLPELLALRPDVLAITGDHSTPVPLKAHSWHPVPLLLWSEHCFADDCRELTEAAAIHGHLGTLPARELMGLLLANAGRLAKYGA